MKDPYSAVYEFREPVDTWTKPIGRDYEYAWVICGTLNAKNSFGGYVGTQPFYVAMRGSEIVNSDLSSPDQFNFHAGVIEKRCQTFYERKLPR